MVYAVLMGVVIVLIYIDLGFLHKKEAQLSNESTAGETAYWVFLAMFFSGVIYCAYWARIVENPNQLTPGQATIKYLTGYLVELSLSVDNLFVMALIFSSMKIPVKYQHRVLFWGILGAMFFRAALIFPGAYLIDKVSWMNYVFGAFLIYTALKILKVEKEKREETMPKATKWVQKLLPTTKNFHGESFWLVENGVKKVTPLFAALLAIELTDILFALDSIPAILAITTDPLLVLSSNLFAILGLRAMYFFLVNMLEQFHYIKYSVFVILCFVGMKLILADYLPISEWISLVFVALSLLFGMLYSKQQRLKE